MAKARRQLRKARLGFLERRKREGNSRCRRACQRKLAIQKSNSSHNRIAAAIAMALAVLPAVCQKSTLHRHFRRKPPSAGQTTERESKNAELCLALSKLKPCPFPGQKYLQTIKFFLSLQGFGCIQGFCNIIERNFPSPHTIHIVRRDTRRVHEQERASASRNCRILSVKLSSSMSFPSWP